MHFGIMSMQIDALIPREAHNASPEAIAGHIAQFKQTELVRSLADHGFKLVELGGDLGLFLPHTFAQGTIQSLVSLKNELELDYTVHLPLWSVEPSTPLQPVRKGSVQALVDTIQTTLPLEPEVFVLHATGALAAEFYRMPFPEAARALLLRQFQSGALESIRSILTATGIPSRKLAIETIEFPFELTLEMAEALDLSICFDTGHVLVGFSGPVDFFDALELCLPRLAEIHLHDGPRQGPDRKIGYGQDHRPLGTGDLDFGHLFDLLMKAQYQGPIIFELRLEEALASLETIRGIRPQALG